MSDFARRLFEAKVLQSMFDGSTPAQMAERCANDAAEFSQVFDVVMARRKAVGGDANMVYATECCEGCEIEFDGRKGYDPLCEACLITTPSNFKPVNQEVEE